MPIDSLFATQVALSFLVGGAYIVFIARIAELFGSVVGGTLASTPTTSLIGSVFITIAEGERALADSVLGIVVAMIATHVLLISFIAANRRMKFWPSVFISIAGWGVTLVIVRSIGLTILTATLAYFCCLIGASLYFRSIPPKYPVQTSASWKVLVIRSIAAGLVVASAVIVARIAGGFWGGIAAGFPVTFLSGLYILNSAQGREFTASFIKVIPLGTLSLAGYVQVLALLALQVHPAIAICIALACSLVLAFGIFKARTRLRFN